MLNEFWLNPRHVPETAYIPEDTDWRGLPSKELQGPAKDLGRMANNLLHYTKKHHKQEASTKNKTEVMW